jgi:adenylosuccinate lyase
LATTRVLVAAIQAGIGREEAHEIIKEHALAEAIERRENPHSTNDLVERLANDQRLPLNHDDLEPLLENPMDFAGNANQQIQKITKQISDIIADHPDAAVYNPETIL